MNLSRAPRDPVVASVTFPLTLYVGAIMSSAKGSLDASEETSKDSSVVKFDGSNWPTVRPVMVAVLGNSSKFQALVE